MAELAACGIPEAAVWTSQFPVKGLTTFATELDAFRVVSLTVQALQKRKAPRPADADLSLVLTEKGSQDEYDVDTQECVKGRSSLASFHQRIMDRFRSLLSLACHAV
jgi:hypothetical protein